VGVLRIGRGTGKGVTESSRLTLRGAILAFIIHRRPGRRQGGFHKHSLMGGQLRRGGIPSHIRSASKHLKSRGRPIQRGERSVGEHFRRR